MTELCKGLPAHPWRAVNIRKGRKRICYRKDPVQMSFELATVVIEVPRFVSLSLPTNVGLYLETGHDYFQVLFYTSLVFTSIHLKQLYKIVDKK